MSHKTRVAKRRHNPARGAARGLKPAARVECGTENDNERLGTARSRNQGLASSDHSFFAIRYSLFVTCYSSTTS